MISLKVDEAYAFDYLSILDVKRKRSQSNNEAWIACYQHLEGQFDSKKWLSMIFSDEYKSMVKANDLTFDAVDKAKNNEVSAQYVDYCNYQRHIAKQNFQKKFFNNDLKEQKFGYEKYKNSSINTN